MKEKWLFPNAIVPVNAETTAALVAEIKRLIDVVGGMALMQPEQEQEPVGKFAKFTDGIWREVTEDRHQEHLRMLEDALQENRILRIRLKEKIDASPKG